MKNIVIIGGGISGCATLHFLMKKYGSKEDVSVTLLEKEDVIGGTIRSNIVNGTLFESGPNGFLSNSPATFEFIKEIGLFSELITADEDSKFRHILSNKEIHTLPYGIPSFVKFKLLPFTEKINLLKALFKNHNISEKITIGDFAKHAIGPQFKDYLIDPMVSGIFGGNANLLNLKHSFPRLYKILASGKSPVRYRKENKNKQKKAQLYTFRAGMQAPVNQVASMYKDNINYGQTVQSIKNDLGKYIIETDKGMYDADVLIISTPAFVASKLLKDVNSNLADGLKEIDYSPIAVVGLSFKVEDVIDIPKGFGVLIPSNENNLVLGVLFESQIFPQRYRENEVVMRVMLGGSHNSKILKRSENEIVSRALKELATMFTIKNTPKKTYFKFWKKAIPQYTNEYVKRLAIINQELDNHPNLFIAANYYNGVSFNDCIKNSSDLAYSIRL